MAPRPVIQVHSDFLKSALAQNNGRFEIVDGGEGPNHFRFAQSPEVLAISIVPTLRVSRPVERDMGEIAAMHQAGAHLQRYVIFDSEYETLRHDVRPYEPWRGSKTKVIFTPNTPVAVQYALGLLYSAAKHGIYS